MTAQIFWHLTLLNGLIPHQVLPNASGTFLAPAWSITLEWQYYLMAPALAIFVRSGGWIVTLSVTAMLAERFCIPWRNLMPAFLPIQIPLFMLGIGSYHLYAWFCETRQKRASYFGIPVAALLSFACLAYPWHTVALSIWALVFGCVFVSGNSLFPRLLYNLRELLLLPWLQALGKISYPIYLVHWPVITLILYLVLYCDAGVSASHALIFLVGVGSPVVILIAWILHRAIETPGNAIGKGKSSKHPL